MSFDFTSELDSILNKNDEKKQQQAIVQSKAKTEAEEFVAAFINA